MNPVTYLKDTISELKAVRWPNRETVVRLTIIVIAISVLVGFYVGSLDFVLTNLLKELVK